MNAVMLLFLLFILSDGTAAALAARGAWMRKLRSTGKRPEFATAFGIGFATYAFVQYLVVFNNFNSSQALAALPPGYLFRSIILRVVQSGAIWLISLTLLGRSPLTGLQKLFALLGKLFALLWKKLRKKFSRKGESNDMSDKDPAAKELVDDLKKDPQDPNAPPPKSPQPQDEQDPQEGNGDDRKGEPIGPGK